jgi:glycosyltransferase involved in cell wall biosynthesis
MRALQHDAILINGALPIRFTQWSCAISHDLEGGGRGKAWLRRLYKFVAYRNVDQIVTTTTELRTALSAEIRVPTRKIRRIPTCVNPTLYADTPYAQRERAILHMGTIWYKNPQATIRAFAQLPYSDARLYMTGNPAQIPADLMTELDPAVRNRITLVGHLPADELRALLGRVMIVSVPSDYLVPVASPTAIESLAAGTPVVGSLGISQDVLVNGHNGYRCAVGDISGLTRHYRALLNDQPLWQQLHEGARRTASQFSADAVALAYVELIEMQRG